MNLRAHLVAALATLVFVPLASAQGRHVFDLDPANSSFTFSGTITVPFPPFGNVTGNIVGMPATVSLDGSVAADVTLVGGQVTQGQLVAGNDAQVVVPTLLGDLVVPIFGSIASAVGTNITLEFTSVDAMGNPAPFAVAPDGSFSTFLATRAVTGTIVVTGAVVNETVVLDGSVSDPQPISGTISETSDGLDLSIPINSTFPFVFPDFSANLTLAGGIEGSDRALAADTNSVVITAGGTQNLRLSAGSSQAGALYIVLSTIAGTDPGVVVAPGVTLPLNPDGFLMRESLLGANGPVWMNTIAALGPSGTADATIQWPGLAFPTLAGVIDVHHAYVTFGGAGGTSASNAVLLSLD